MDELWVMNHLRSIHYTSQPQRHGDYNRGIQVGDGARGGGGLTVGTPDGGGLVGGGVVDERTVDNDDNGDNPLLGMWSGLLEGQKVPALAVDYLHVHWLSPLQQNLIAPLLMSEEDGERPAFPRVSDWGGLRMPQRHYLSFNRVFRVLKRLLTKYEEVGGVGRVGGGRWGGGLGGWVGGAVGGSSAV